MKLNEYAQKQRLRGPSSKVAVSKVNSASRKTQADPHYYSASKIDNLY